jgi:predicted esterase
MGAFVTAATVGAYPGVFRAASHTAGGSVPDGTPNAAAPTESQVRGISTPYQMHHGDADVVVALSADQRFAALLTSRGVTNELLVYAGATHPDVASSQTVLARVRTWYQAHGVLNP